MTGTLRALGIFVLLAVLSCSAARAEDSAWPRTVELEQGTVTVYEPQVDELSDDFVSFRSALAYRETPDAEPVFGAGWFESDVQVDRMSRTVHPVELRVTQTRFPVSADIQTYLSDEMSKPLFASHFTFSLDELQASARLSQQEAEAAEKLNTAPPDIIYRDEPALLVSIDGEPVLREIENSTYQAVINTPYPLIFDGQWYYLNAAKDVWYRASSATGPYRFIDEAPAEIALMVKLDDETLAATEDTRELAGGEAVTAANAPEIIVSTRPAELVVTEGPAAFVPLVDDLLVLNNSEDDVFMHLGEQEYYIVLAGRWYRSKSLNGPWTFQDSSQLPDAFTRIPQESDQAESRVYVAGTGEAEEAVLDAQVPQTAAVQRGEADVEVQYDGDPVFETVDGTDMVYAANSGSTVILSDGLYYLVEDGVWYVSTSPNGPWQVSVARPDQVRVILPTSPVYNVKYVYVYGYTPDVVYVGYTPGYLGSYVYGSTVFYGSGWHYRPWVSPHYYYPHHSTWGFHVRYDPWYGWNFGLSWAWGPFSVAYWPGGHWHHHHHWHHRHYSYWGPHGYRPRHHRHHRPKHHGRPGHGRPGHGNRPQPYERHHNLYRDERQPALVADTHDKSPRGFTGRGGQETRGGKALAKNRPGFVPKAKQAHLKPGPLSRNDLAAKARTRDQKASGGKAQPGGKAWAKSMASGKFGDKTLKTQPRALTRGDLAQKARSTDQQYRSAQKKVKASGKSKNKAAAFRPDKAAQLSARNAWAKAAPQVKQQSRTKATPTIKQQSRVKATPRVKQPSGSTVTRKARRPSSGKAVVKSTSRPTIKASPGKIKRPSATRSAKTPVVKLTGQTRSSASRYKAAPQARAKSQPARQQKAQASYRPQTQKKANPAPQKSSRQTTRSKSKQKWSK